jgi:hypothetical protein
MIRRCKLCILPENYPGIVFDRSGVCQFCTGHREKQYAGAEALNQAVAEVLANTDPVRGKDYDCLVGVSGGRDSSFLLYYFTTVLKRKVLAFCIDNGFIPGQAKQNMERITSLVGAKLVTETHDSYKRCIRHYVSSWLKKPSAPMTGMLCTGCKYNIVKRMKEYAEAHGIPLVILGETPYEAEGHYKRNLMKRDPFSGAGSAIDGSFIAGYISQVIKNPRWIMNPHSLSMQFKEYAFYFRKNIMGTGDFQILFPFMTHIKWEERSVMETLTDKLGWQKKSGLELNWRIDCEVAILKMYLYKKTLGFNDLDEGFSCLIRDGQLSRAVALERLANESDIDENAVAAIVEKIGIDPSIFARVIKTIDTPVISPA